MSGGEAKYHVAFPKSHSKRQSQDLDSGLIQSLGSFCHPRLSGKCGWSLGGLRRAMAGPWGAGAEGKVVADGGPENPQSGRQVASGTCRQLPPPPRGAAGERRCPIPHERNISVNRIRLTPWAGSLIHFTFISSLRLSPRGGEGKGAEKAVRGLWGRVGILHLLVALRAFVAQRLMAQVWNPMPGCDFSSVLP